MPDLDSTPVAGAAGQNPEGEAVVRLQIPLVIDGNDSNFEDIVATSQAVPVVLLVWSPRSLESKQLIAAMEDLARDSAGDFQLVRIDADACPAIAQALRVQEIPTLLALLGARPIPIGQGPLTKEQIRPALPQLLEAAAQLGVTAKIAVDEADTAEPTPEEHLPALEAEAAGDLDAALAAWEKVVDLNSRDEKAKAELARVRLLLRSAAADVEGAPAEDPQARADALLAAGRPAEAFDLLLDAMSASRQAEERDRMRERLVDLFRIAGPTPEVRAARKRLTTLLMV
ncbi:tetratricopeptide repeat protein [Schaalia sp. 19OD2882]|uniref:tetratricopeptide repeat protein n=1 Tax=Schaalia sp. 19OD2882 TaxID=2794089 RepID=UPI001C1ED1F1|nr:tetratricopeptide repeat protein [Schaalia sp. 19OD2882]QWW20369.1 tetratricopeptide repeat protein [Schaalia sp. 19OD2882]